jgi:2-polyprenyl-6-methoxyphenol hydroxylase-like FAD-dependent oxidoreductase
MPRIAIVGAGIAGLHLGLLLQQQGVDATIYADRGPDEIRRGRLPNTVALVGATRVRDRALGVNHWDAPEHDTKGVHFYLNSDPPLQFRGKLEPAGQFIDMRMYVARLLEDFATRGGPVVIGALDPAGVERIAREHDLVVVATGRAGLADMFPRVAERSPFTQPQRTILAGLFRGIRLPETAYFNFQVASGQGEIFEQQFLTFQGMVPGLLLEGLPGSDIERVARMRHEDDPAGFVRALYELLQEYAPLTRQRLDRDTFDVLGPLDVLSGAITPTVRRGHVTLGNGRCVMALGDAHIAHDPAAGQGANAASRAAWTLGELLISRVREGNALDEAFCAQAEQRLWDVVRPMTEFSNAMLGPPEPHALGIFLAAAQNPALADGFINNFNYPDRMWECLGSPEGAQRFLAQFA